MTPDIRFQKIEENKAKTPKAIHDRLLELSQELHNSTDKLWCGVDARELTAEGKSVIVDFCPLRKTIVVGSLTIWADGHVTDREGIATKYLNTPYDPIEHHGPESGPLGEDHFPKD